MEICPRCNQRFTRALHSGDYVHTCNSGDKTLDQEDVLVLGTYTNESTESIVTINPQEAMRAGLVNELQGTEAQIRDNADIGEFTIRGNKAELYRQRQHEQYIK